MLGAAPVLVLEGRHVYLVPPELTGFHACEGGGRGVTPLRHEDDERQGLTGALKQILWRAEGSKRVIYFMNKAIDY